MESFEKSFFIMKKVWQSILSKKSLTCFSILSWTYFCQDYNASDAELSNWHKHVEFVRNWLQIVNKIFFLYVFRNLSTKMVEIFVCNISVIHRTIWKKFDVKLSLESFRFLGNAKLGKLPFYVHFLFLLDPI